MVEEELIALYKKTKKQLAALVDDLSFVNFYRALQSGRRSYSVKNTQTSKTIDETWVNAIKEAVPYLDTIVNNPRKYMKRETEVVPVEKARVVDAESVRHLASHTNLINSVTNGVVRPQKILTAYNEENLELYENRFVVTLILKVSQFIDRRYFLLGAGGSEFSTTLDVDGNFEQAGEDTDYRISMTVHQGAEYFEGGVEEQIYADLFMIRKYVNSFKYSPFMKALGTCAPVRPPVVKTNLLVKEPNYAACLKLWDFIEDYDKAGYKIEIKDSAPRLNREEIDEMDLLQVLQYLALKNCMAGYDERRRPMIKCDKKIIKPTLEEFESDDKKKNEQNLPFGGFSLKETMDGTAKKDIDEAVKNALINALRKEQIKQDMKEEERKNREELLCEVVSDALGHNREIDKLTQKYTGELAALAVKDALKKEQQYQRELSKIQSKREQAVEKMLSSQIEKMKNDEREQLKAKKREEREQERLMEAILKDMLEIESERQYVKESPVVLYGHENMPVPMGGDRLPMVKEFADLYYDMFKVPLQLEPEDWEEIYALKQQKNKPRRRVAEDRLVDALKRAMRLEQKREKNRLKEETEAALREQATAADGDLPKDFESDMVDSDTRSGQNNQSDSRENTSGGADTAGGDEPIGGETSHGRLNAFDGGERASGGGENAQAEPAARQGEPQENEGNAHAGVEPRKDSGRGSAKGQLEEKESFWHRLIRILFFWWRK